MNVHKKNGKCRVDETLRRLKRNYGTGYVICKDHAGIFIAWKDYKSKEGKLTNEFNKWKCQNVKGSRNKPGYILTGIEYYGKEKHIRASKIKKVNIQ